MKKFIKKCYRCNADVVSAKIVKEGIALNGLRCPKCGEEYFTSSELIRFDILTGRREMIRKFGTLGDSMIIRIPNKIKKDFKLKPEDYAVFEERPDGILIKPMDKKEIAG